MSIEIGDRVVCVDASNHTVNGIQSNLQEGREYIVYGINTCNCCTAFDVGIIVPSTVYAPLDVCNGCGKITPFDKRLWAKSTRFRKVETRKEYKVVKSSIEIQEPCLSYLQ